MFRAAIFAAFSKPCSAALSVFIVVGHVLAYDWDLLSLSWNPLLILPMSGIIYIILIIFASQLLNGHFMRYVIEEP